MWMVDFPISRKRVLTNALEFSDLPQDGFFFTKLIKKALYCDWMSEALLVFFSRIFEKLALPVRVCESSFLSFPLSGM